MANKRPLTQADHYAYGQRLKQVSQMLSPVQSELQMDFGARTQVGRAAARLGGVQTILADLQQALNDAFTRERQSAGAPSSPRGG